MRTKRLAAGGGKDHGHSLPERCSPGNQCLGKEMNAERGAEKSFLTDSDIFIVETHGCPHSPTYDNDDVADPHETWLQFKVDIHWSNAFRQPVN
jgi:hypothetical protein